MEDGATGNVRVARGGARMMTCGTTGVCVNAAPFFSFLREIGSVICETLMRRLALLSSKIVGRSHFICSDGDVAKTCAFTVHIC